LVQNETLGLRDTRSSLVRTPLSANCRFPVRFATTINHGVRGFMHDKPQFTRRGRARERNRGQYKGIEGRTKGKGPTFTLPPSNNILVASSFIFTKLVIDWMDIREA